MLGQIYHETKKIETSFKIRVNYSTSKVIMISRSNLNIIGEYIKKIVNYKISFNCNELDIV